MAELPDDIHPIVRRHAVEITDTRWDYDAGRVIDRVERVLADSPKRQRFLAQVPPWDHKGWQWVMDDPPSEEEDM